MNKFVKYLTTPIRDDEISINNCLETIRFLTQTKCRTVGEFEEMGVNHVW